MKVTLDCKFVPVVFNDRGSPLEDLRDATNAIDRGIDEKQGRESGLYDLSTIRDQTCGIIVTESGTKLGFVGYNRLHEIMKREKKVSDDEWETMRHKKRLMRRLIRESRACR